MKQIAQLDENNIYLGVIEIADDALLPEHIELPEGCDLPPNKYRWDGKTFCIITDPDRLIIGNPSPINAIAIGFIALHNSGLILPGQTLAWLDVYVRSIDFEIPIDTQQALEAFHLAKAFLNRGQP